MWLLINGNISPIHRVWMAKVKSLFIGSLALALAFTVGAETSSCDPLALNRRATTGNLLTLQPLRVI
jgi:hypothetical protein